MANERKDQILMLVSKDGVTVQLANTKNTTLTGDGKWTNVQAIGTSWEQIVFDADLITEGITAVGAINLGANYVELAKDAAGSYIFAKLLAGEGCLVPVNCAASANPTWYARANTAACNVQFGASGT